MNTPESDPSQSPPSGLQVELGAKPTRHRRAVWLVPMLAFLAIATGGVVLLYGQQTGPTIRWSSASVLEFLQPGDKKKITISFVASQDIPSASASVTPSLASVVSVSPQSLGGIRANRDNRITLELTAPAQAQIKFEGTLHIRSGQPPGNIFAQPLPVTIVIHNDPVPPDPGEAGKQTIEGIDSDGDGVRDDVQRYIVLNYLTRDVARDILNRFAFHYQVLLTSTDPATIDVSRKQRKRLTGCWLYSFNDNFAGLNDVRALLLNTADRLIADRNSSKPYSGKIQDIAADELGAAACVQ